MPWLLSESAFQSRYRFVDNSALFAESKADKMVRITGRKERAERDQRDTGLAHQPLAEGEIAFIGQPADIGGKEVRSLADKRSEAEPRHPFAQQIAIDLKRPGQIQREIDFVLERMGDAELKRGRRREGDELVRVGDDAHQVRRPGHPTDLPP